MAFKRFIAVGDSCTEGLDDPYPGGQVYRGWADLVAAELADRTEHGAVRYANLGVRGRRLDQITEDQISRIAELEPDLVALFGGGNDVLTRGWRAEVVAERVDRAIRALTEVCETVVVFTLSDLSGRVPFIPGLRGRIAALNDAIRRAAAEHGAVLVELEHDQAAHDLRYFGRDRLHLGEHGHRRVAAHMLRALGLPYDEEWLDPLPTAHAPLWRERLSDLAWMWYEVRPVMVSRIRNRIVGRSPGDGFLPKRPELSPVRAELP